MPDANDRWCGSCGAALPADDDAVATVTSDPTAGGDAAGRPSPDAPDDTTAAVGPAWTRRRLLTTGAVAVLGGAIGWVARGPGTPDWIDAGTVDELLATIEQTGWAPVPGLDPPDWHAVVRWDPSVIRGDGLEARILYSPEPVVDRTTGLMVLVLRSTHGGCRAPYCMSSGWFEDVCFGSRFNAWGEWVGGPAPRALDRRPSRVVDGRLEVNRIGYTVGIERDQGLLRQEARGPSCLDL